MNKFFLFGLSYRCGCVTVEPRLMRALNAGFAWAGRRLPAGLNSVRLNMASISDATSFYDRKSAVDGLQAAGGQILYGRESSCRSRIDLFLFDCGASPTGYTGSS